MADNKLKELGEKIDAKGAQLHKIFADHPDMNMTAEEAASAKALNDELSDLGKEYDGLKALDDMRVINERRLTERGQAVRPEPVTAGTDPSKVVKSLGQQYTENSEYLYYKGRSNPKFAVELPNVDMKTTMVEGGPGYAPANNRTNRVVLSALRAPMVADLIPQDSTDLQVIRWMEETTFTNNAAGVAEAAQKPESALAYTERTQLVEVIATFLPVTNQQLDDIPGMRSLIDSRLTLMLALAEENALLNGSGTSPQLQGFYTKSGIQTQAKATDPGPDAIYKAFTKVRWTGFANPTGVIMHPNDWQNIRLLRTADGIYIWGNPSEAGVERIWGVPVVVTSAATQGTALTGDFGLYSHISRKMGVRIDVSDSHNDFFIKNLQAIRIEERLSLEIYRAAAFATVTGL